MTIVSGITVKMSPLPNSSSFSAIAPIAAAPICFSAIAAAIALTSWWGASAFSAFSSKPKVNVEEKERQIQSYLYTQAQDNQRTNEEETFDYRRIQDYATQDYNRAYIPAVMYNFSNIDNRMNEHLK